MSRFRPVIPNVDTSGFTQAAQVAGDQRNAALNRQASIAAQTGEIVQQGEENELAREEMMLALAGQRLEGKKLLAQTALAAQELASQMEQQQLARRQERQLAELGADVQMRGQDLSAASQAAELQLDQGQLDLGAAELDLREKLAGQQMSLTQGQQELTRAQIDATNQRTQMEGRLGDQQFNIRGEELELERRRVDQDIKNAETQNEYTRAVTEKFKVEIRILLKQLEDPELDQTFVDGLSAVVQQDPEMAMPFLRFQLAYADKLGTKEQQLAKQAAAIKLGQVFITDKFEKARDDDEFRELVELLANDIGIELPDANENRGLLSNLWEVRENPSTSPTALPIPTHPMTRIATAPNRAIIEQIGRLLP